MYMDYHGPSPMVSDDPAAPVVPVAAVFPASAAAVFPDPAAAASRDYDALAPSPSRSRAFQPKAPPVYTGQDTSDSAALRNWIFASRRYLQLVGASQDEEVLVASTYLEGKASLWFQTWYDVALASSSTAFVAWDVFVAALRSAFSPPNHQYHLRERLANLAQKGSLADYVAEFRGIRLELEISDSEALDRFIRGLRPYTQGQIHLYAPETVIKAIEIADKIEASYLASRRAAAPHTPSRLSAGPSRLAYGVGATVPPRASPVPRTAMTNYATAMPSSSSSRAGAVNPGVYPGGGPAPMAIDAARPVKLTNEERERLRAQGSCFRCRRPGHFAPACNAFADRRVLSSSVEDDQAKE